FFPRFERAAKCLQASATVSAKRSARAWGQPTRRKANRACALNRGRWARNSAVTLRPVRGVTVVGMVVSGGAGTTPAPGGPPRGPGRPPARAGARPDPPGGAGEAGAEALSPLPIMVTATGAEFTRGAGPPRVIRNGPVVIPARRFRQHAADAGGSPRRLL